MTVALLPDVFRNSTLMQVFLTSGKADGWMTLAALGVQFFLSILACSVEAPGGLFFPSLVLGAAAGNLVGLVDQYWFGDDPILFSLTGMAAFFGAIAKVPVTAIVIVFEMTTNFKLVLPLMIASVVAYLVAERLAPGSLYTHLLAMKGIQLQPGVVNDGLWAQLTAADVMQHNVETLTSHMAVDEVIQTFAKSHHRGFPVLDQDGKLVGIVTQTDLDKVTHRHLSGTTPLREIMTSQPITVSPGDTLSRVLYLLSHYRVSRLPVVEHRRLIGIITRSDILRVESARLQGGDDPLRPQAHPSYVIYQTRSPTTGKGRLLLPLSNPATADKLITLALVLAREKGYEIECLHTILIPRHQIPSETPVDIESSHHLLQQAIHQGQLWKVPVHTQIRTAHTATKAILDAHTECHASLLLMGWKGSTATPGRIFGDTIDALIRQANCDVMLVKLGTRLLREAHPNQDVHPSVNSVLGLVQLNRWLIPIAGGPNAQHAVHLLPALVSLSQQPQIQLCQVYHPSDLYTPNLLEEDAAFLRQHIRGEVTVTPVCADSVADAVIDMAKNNQCDVIVVGASREGLLHQVIQGNIPETIARQCNCTVILVRKATE
jgi:CIC family chloride channel protein